MQWLVNLKVFEVPAKHHPLHLTKSLWQIMNTPILWETLPEGLWIW